MTEKFDKQKARSAVKALPIAAGMLSGALDRIDELEDMLTNERGNLIEAGGEPVKRRLLEEDEKELWDLAREQLQAEGKL